MFLSLLFLSSLTSAASAAVENATDRSARISGAFGRFRTEKGPLRGWRSDTLAAFSKEIGMSSLFQRKIAGPPPLDGYALCGMDEATVAAFTQPAFVPDDGVDSNDDAEAASLKDETVAFLSDRRDVKALCKLANASRALTLADIIEGFGAEDFDLLLLRDLSRNDFHTLLWALSCSPHVGVIGARIFAPELDLVVFGRNESALKSPFSWPLAILAPGILAARYLHYFYDTNPLLSSLLVVVWVVSDLTFWLQLLMIAIIPGSRVRVLQRILVRVASSVASVLAYRYAIFPIIPRLVVDVSFHAFTLIAPIVTVVYVWGSLRDTLYAFRLRLASNSKAVIDARVRDRVVEAIRRLEADPARGFEESDSHALYEFQEGSYSGNYLANGSFGTCYHATRVNSPPSSPRVCLKILNTKSAAGRAEIVSRVVEGVVEAAVLGVSSMASDIVQATADKIAFGNDAALVKDALYERRCLAAASAVAAAVASPAPHPGIIAFESAHTLPQRTLVTRLEKGDLMNCLPAGATAADRARIFARLIDAAAALHKGGIFHRDIKPANICLSASDPLQPVIIDVGTFCLPEGDDPTEGLTVTEAFLAPEAMRARNALGSPPSDADEPRRQESAWQASLSYLKKAIAYAFNANMGISQAELRVIAGGTVGFASDVWATALVGVSIFSGEQDPLVSFILEQHENADDDDKTTRIRKGIIGITEATIKRFLSKKIPGAPAPVRALIARMLQPSPLLRPSAEEAAAAAASIADDLQRSAAQDPASEASAAFASPSSSIISPPPSFSSSSSLVTPPPPSGASNIRLLRAIAQQAAASSSGRPSPPASASETLALIPRLRAAVHRLSPRGGGLSLDLFRGILRDETIGLGARLGAAVVQDDDASAQLFGALDADGGGSLGVCELLSGVAVLLAPTATAADAMRLALAAFDADEDGFLAQGDMERFVAFNDLAAPLASTAADAESLGAKAQWGLAKQRIHTIMLAISSARPQRSSSSSGGAAKGSKILAVTPDEFVAYVEASDARLAPVLQSFALALGVGAAASSPARVASTPANAAAPAPAAAAPPPEAPAAASPQRQLRQRQTGGAKGPQKSGGATKQ